VIENPVLLSTTMSTGREGLQAYYQQKIEEYEQRLRDKEADVKRLEVQRNEWNSKGTIIPFSNTWQQPWHDA
jgi:hypothetical protein